MSSPEVCVCGQGEEVPEVLSRMDQPHQLVVQQRHLTLVLGEHHVVGPEKWKTNMIPLTFISPREHWEGIKIVLLGCSLPEKLEKWFFMENLFILCNPSPFEISYTLIFLQDFWSGSCLVLANQIKMWNKGAAMVWWLREKTYNR